MRQSLQTVKEFSPYGWGVTVLILVLDMYNAKTMGGGELYQKELDELRMRVSTVEVSLNTLQNGVRDIQLEIKTARSEIKEVQKIGCIPLTRAQRSVLSGCED